MGELPSFRAREKWQLIIRNLEILNLVACQWLQEVIHKSRLLLISMLMVFSTYQLRTRAQERPNQSLLDPVEVSVMPRLSKWSKMLKLPRKQIKREEKQLISRTTL